MEGKAPAAEALAQAVFQQWRTCILGEKKRGGELFSFCLNESNYYFKTGILSERHLAFRRLAWNLFHVGQ